MNTKVGVGRPWLAGILQNHTSSLLAWVFYILLGYLVAQDLDGYRAFARRYALPLALGAVFCAGIMVAEFFLGQGGPVREFTSSRPILLFLMPCLLPLGFTLWARAGQAGHAWTGWIARYSLYSFGIYLAHIYVLYRVELFYTGMKLALAPGAQFVLFLGLTLAGSLALTWFISRLPLGGSLVTVARVPPPPVVRVKTLPDHRKEAGYTIPAVCH